MTYLLELMAQNIIVGTSIDRLTREITKQFGKNYRASAKGLLLTETAYIKGQADKLTYEKLEIEKYEILVTLDDEKNDTKMLSITQDELDEILNKRLARQEEKLEKKFKAEKEEELRKSKLSQAEKEAEERKELQDELAKAKEENRPMKLEGRTSELLNEHELPQSFKGFLIGQDEEATEANIEAFEDIYLAEIKKAAEEKWKSKAPGTAKKEATAEEIAWSDVVIQDYSTDPNVQYNKRLSIYEDTQLFM